MPSSTSSLEGGPIFEALLPTYVIFTFVATVGTRNDQSTTKRTAGPLAALTESPGAV